MRKDSAAGMLPRALIVGVAASGWSDMEVSAASIWSDGSVYAQEDSTDIRMAEELVLVEPGQETAQVTVHFRFENKSASEQNVAVGFPVLTTPHVAATHRLRCTRRAA